MSLDNIAQVFIGLFGVTGIFLVARKNKWGFVLGLCASPFWVITSIIHRQWGILILSVFYALSWSMGIREWFFKKEERNGRH